MLKRLSRLYLKFQRDCQDYISDVKETVKIIFQMLKRLSRLYF